MNIELVSSRDKDAINFYGGNRQAFESRDPYVILVGAANTGKTYALCWKMHMYCLKYPGVQVLLTRKSLRSLRDSAVRSYQKVLLDSGMSDKVRTLGETRPTNFIYDYSERQDGDRIYKGKSEIILAPLDMKGKALGAQYDMVYVNQPDTEGTTMEEFKLIKSRARLENAPYRQLLADPNPSHDKHWLLIGELQGDWKMFTSTHKDNPSLYNNDKQEWTPLGLEQMEELKNLPGHMKESLYKGQWYSNAGMAFAAYWQPEKHILYLDSEDAVSYGVSRYDEEKAQFINCVPQDWHHYLAIDWGGTDPFVAILIARHPTMDLMIAHKHIYITNLDINSASVMTAKMVEGYNLKAVIADKGKAETWIMESHLGLPIISAKKGAGSNIDSINICISELNAERWKFVNTDDALFNPKDEELVKHHRPMGAEEIPNLKKDEKTGGITAHQNDHFYDAWKYFCRYWIELNGGARKRETVIWI